MSAGNLNGRLNAFALQTGRRARENALTHPWWREQTQGPSTPQEVRFAKLLLRSG